MKHTSGPWVVNDFCTEGGADTAVWTSHDPHTAKSICECHFNTHADLMRGEIGCHQLEAEANAKLIAAAPELLETLNELFSAGLTQMPSYEAGKEAQDAWADRRAAARNKAAELISRLS